MSKKYRMSGLGFEYNNPDYDYKSPEEAAVCFVKGMIYNNSGVITVTDLETNEKN